VESAKQNLEARVDARTTELREANRQLESFCYTVSHDLRSPLRSIDGFSHALVEDYATQLDDNAQNYLDRIRFSAQRMGHLIDDLLQLSRIGRAPSNIERVDLSAIAREVAGTILERYPGRPIDIQIQPNLHVRGDPRLLRIALENLLDNACKFTAKQEHPRITLGKTEENNKPVIFVQDNGIGFNTAYAGKLFQPFTRLHTQNDFDGTGIGLATVERIVSVHKGRIWARSQPAEGATFYIQLPGSVDSSDE
jgi:light-regulated signal transduction histidine kinase (bacteriophytochrome)